MENFVRISIGDVNDFLPFNASDIASLFIGGASGSGKSVLLHQLIRQVTEKYSLDEAKLLLIDPKCVGFSDYRGYSNLLQPIITEKETAVEALETLAKKGSDTLVFIMLDEYADWSFDKRFSNVVKDIACHGKNKNLYLYVATQCVVRDIITDDFYDAFDNVAALHTQDEEASRLLIGASGAELLPPYGELILLKRQKINELNKI